MSVRLPQFLTGILTLVTTGALATVAAQTGGSMRSVVPSPWVSDYVFGRAVSADGSISTFSASRGPRRRHATSAGCRSRDRAEPGETLRFQLV